MNHTINEKELTAFKKSFDKKAKYKVAQRAVCKNGINECAVDEDLKRTIHNTFNVNVDAGDVCNQKHSGRCWMFAGLNVLRTIVMKKLGLKNLELSQAYLQFYDKLEKFNFYLERGIELADEEFNSRLNVFVLDSGIGDGGHFVMFTNLVKKYGVLPIEEMPDLAVSQDTTALNNVLSHLLAQAIMEFREAKKDVDKQAKIKESYLNDVYRILTISLGVPPKDFVYSYVDKDNKAQTLKRMTPKEFYDEYVGADLDQYVCLCDAPIENKELYKKYTCHYCGNVEGGDPISFFQVPNAELKKAAIASLQGGDVLWFAADVSSMSLRKDGYLVNDILKTNDLFDVDYRMNKKERMTYRTSFCNHAMTLTGVNLDKKGKPERWKVENSWGKDNGFSGYYVMDDKWFSEYLNQVFVNRKYLSEELLKKYDTAEVIEEEPFDTVWSEIN